MDRGVKVRTPCGNKKACIASLGWLGVVVFDFLGKYWDGAGRLRQA